MCHIFKPVDISGGVGPSRPFYIKKCGFLVFKFRNELLKKHKIVISVDGPDENVLKMKPPMCLTVENAAEVLRALKGVLEQRRIATKNSK